MELFYCWVVYYGVWGGLFDQGKSGDVSDFESALCDGADQWADGWNDNDRSALLSDPAADPYFEKAV